MESSPLIATHSFQMQILRHTCGWLCLGLPVSPSGPMGGPLFHLWYSASAVRTLEGATSFLAKCSLKRLASSIHLFSLGSSESAVVRGFISRTRRPRTSKCASEYDALPCFAGSLSSF